MAIAADGARPPLGLVMPDGSMVVEAESQVVLNQVFARSLQADKLQLSTAPTAIMLSPPASLLATCRICLTSLTE